MFYYNQNDYSNVPYNKPDGTKTTVAKGGCGVCSALMVLNNLYGKEVMTVPQMAQFSINCGARINDGTDMTTLMTALAKKYSIKFKATQYNAELLECLKQGGMAVINQGGKYDVFSNAGHFVVGYKLANAKTVICLDPSLYAGKYQIHGRPNKIVKQVGNEIYVTINEISKATQDRNPCYWLVWFTGKKNKPSVKVGQTVTLKTKAKVYKYDRADSPALKISDISQFDVSAQCVLKKGAKVKVDKVIKKSNGNIWIYSEHYKGYIGIYSYRTDTSKV